MMTMKIGFSEPLSRGWERMKKALFQPFDLNKWMRLGFTAWLAGLTDCSGGGGGNGGGGYHNADLDEFFRFPGIAWNWLQSHPLWFSLILTGVIMLFVVGIILTWVSSRGKFMFLHNVVHNSHQVSKPWSDYRKEGNSLFFWRFFFGIIVVLLFTGFFIYCFIAAKAMYYGDSPNVVIFWKIAGMVLVFLALIIMVGYISLFLNDFVVPVMYKHRLGINAAWLKFLPLFGKYFYLFIVYGLFILVLWTAAVVVILFIGLFTCCIGLLLLAIPYIGAVILLPVSYTFRALSIEFLAQFGEEFNVFPVSGELQIQPE